MRLALLIFAGLIALWWFLVERNARKGKPSPELLVQDPECGVFVTEAEAIRMRLDGKEYHFCSTACRDAFRKKRSGKDAENGSGR